MSQAVFHRKELMNASLQLGDAEIDLADYATTGLRVVSIAPSGMGKTNAGLVIAEQLADQGWVCVLVSAESELEQIYGDSVDSPETLEALLESREKKFIVVTARSAAEFVPYAEAIFRIADRCRKPIFTLLDEGQLFSATRGRKDGVGESSDLINDFVGRGRKRALDLYISALAYSGSLNRSVFRNKTITLVGRQEDSSSWSSLSPQFKGTRINFRDLMALAPSEFFCFHRAGVEKIVMQMSAGMARVAPPARKVRRALPETFSQWDEAMRAIPKPRLLALTDPLIDLMGTVAGLTAQQLMSGTAALRDELESRP